MMGSGNISRRYGTVEQAGKAKQRLDEAIAKLPILTHGLKPRSTQVWTRLQGRRVYMYYRGFSLDDWPDLMHLWRGVEGG